MNVVSLSGIPASCSTMLAAQSPRRAASTSMPTTGPIPSWPGVMKSRAVPSVPTVTIFRLYRLLRYRFPVFASQAVPSAVRSRSGSSKAVVLVEIGRREDSMLAATSLHRRDRRRRSNAESAGASSTTTAPSAASRARRARAESLLPARAWARAWWYATGGTRGAMANAFLVPSRYPPVSPRANASSPPCTRAPICS